MRRSLDVVTELLEAMDRTVKDYGTLVPTPATISELVDGTSVYPGGTGVWRGEEPHGLLPEEFPESPFMFVAHNWYNEDGFRKAKDRGSEEVIEELFWTRLRAYLNHEGIPEQKCFFTNALMGLIPDNMKVRGRQEGGGSEFRAQCRKFFDEQVRIVCPRLVVVMGCHAKSELADFTTVPKVEIPHPSSHKHGLVKYPGHVAKKVARLTEFLLMYPEMRNW